MDILRQAVAEIFAMTPEFAFGDTQLLRQMQACMRFSFLMAGEKLDFLEHVLWLLVRLHQPGIRERCLAEWAEKDNKDEHHPVSKEFLTPGSEMQRDIVAVLPDGSGMSAKLTEA